MADITQKLGFDASQAIETINLLNQALQSLNSILGNTGAAIQNWNSIGGAATQQFTSMKNAADAARKSIEALTNAQTAAATAATKANINPANATVPPPPPDLSSYVSSIQALGAKLGEIPVQASESSRRSYASAVASLAEYAQKNKISVSDVEKAWSNSGNVVTGAANTLANKCQAVKNAHEQMAQSIQKDSGTVSQAWSLMLRMAAFQAIHQAVSGLINLFKQAVTEAVDFGKRLAEVGTIMGKPFELTTGELDKVGQRLIELSNTYGGQAKDVAEAYYQVLSSQVGSATESMHVLEEAMKFGVATNTGMAESVKLVTAALNGWGLAANRAGDATGILFQSVATGRFHAKELADILGRVGPVARDMGVSMEETFAIMDTMTRSGVREDTAVTQLRGTLTQLLKPTKELKEQFQTKWGVENAEQAIQAFGGLVPLLKALAEQTHGNTAEMAEFFKNVRALTGVIQVTGTQLTRMEQNLKDLKASGSDLTNWATGFVLDTPAKKAELAWTQLKNTMLKLATDALPALTSLTNALTSIVKHFDELKTAALALVAGGLVYWLGSVAVGLYSVGVAGALASKSFMGLALAAAAIVGVKLGEWLYFGNKVDWDKLEADQRSANEKFLSNQAELTSKMAREREKALGETMSDAQKVFSAYEMMTSASKKSLLEENQAFSEVMKKRLNDVVKDEESILQRLDTLQNESYKKQIDREKATAANTQALEDRKFQLLTANFSSFAKMQAEEDRASQLHSKVTSALALASNDEQLDSIKSLIEEEKRYGQSATNTAQQMGYSGQALQNVFSREKQAYTDLMTLEKKRADIAQQNAEKAKAAEAEELARMIEMKKLIKEIMDAGNMYVKEGDKWIPKGPEQAAKDMQSLSTAMEKLFDMSKTGFGNKLSLADTLGIGDLIRKQQGALGSLPAMQLQVELNYKKSMQQLTAELDMIPKALQKAFDLKATDSISDLRTKYMEAGKELKDLEGKLDSVRDAEKGVKQWGESAVNVLKEIPTDLNFAAGFNMFTKEQEASKIGWGPALEKAKTDFAELNNQAQQLVTKDMRNKEVIQEIVAWTEKWKEFVRNYSLGSQSKIVPVSAGDVTNLAKMREQMDMLFNKWKEVGKTTGESTDLAKQIEAIKEKMQAADQFLKALKTEMGTVPAGAKALETIYKNMGDNSKDVKDNSNGARVAIENAVGPAQQLATALAQAAAASSQIQPQTAATGGLIRHLAAGGPSGIGTDTVPAMLTPGEFVMNSRATSRFFSQLVAMNAGTTPQGRATGGPITNFGDINVSVNGGGGSRQTARDIGAALRRELRRGTSSLG